MFGSPPYPVRIATVHCLDGDLRHRNISCVACSTTNLALYRRSRRSLEVYSGIGSDWPLLLGTSPRHLPLAVRVFRASLQKLMSLYTIEGYRVYSMPHDGDLVAYDEDLDLVIEGRALPSLVTVAGRVVVDEKKLRESGLTLSDIEREVDEAIREAYERYKTSGDLKPPRPLRVDETLSLASL